jgi:peptidoglycan hydrolase CwlO-like protein
MKRTIVLIAALFTVSVSTVSFANAAMKMDSKDGMRECTMQPESIQQKITRLEKEINKGASKYSSKELAGMQANLADANAILGSLTER